MKLREKVTELVAQQLFATSAAALRPGLRVTWEEWSRQPIEVHDTWRDVARPVVDQLLEATLFHIEVHLERAAFNLWKAGVGYAALTDDEWLKLSPTAREHYFNGVRAVLAGWAAPGIFARMPNPATPRVPHAN